MARRRHDVLEDTLDDALNADAPALGVLADEDDDTWVSAPAADDDLWDSTEDVIEEESEPETVAEPPVSDVLGARTLAGMKAKMRKEPLSKQANEWLLTTFLRVADELRDVETGGGGTRSFPEVLVDLRVLAEHVERRELVDKIHASVWEYVQGALADRLEPVPAQRFEVTEAGRAALEAEGGGVIRIPLECIDPDPAQARDEGADDELADSIKANGVLQPIRVYRHPSPHGIVQWMIDDGERRWRGSKKAGLADIPAREVDPPIDEGEKLLRQSLLNEGKRLKPMEEARTWKRIMTSKGWKITQLAHALGRAKSTVSDRLALLEAPEPFHQYFMDGTLSAAAAPIVRRLSGISAKDAEELIRYASNDERWEEAVAAGKPVPLNVAEEAINLIIQDEFPVLYPTDAATDAYKGPVVIIEKTRYAIDRDQYDKIEEATQSEERQAAATSRAQPDPAAAKFRADEKARRERDRKEREKAEAKKAAEIRLRAAQFAAVSVKLPTEINGAFALLLVRVLVQNVGWDLSDGALVAMGVPFTDGKTRGGRDFPKLVGQHAEKLDTKGRIRLLLQLATWSERAPYSKESDHLTAAAQLLRIDLKKVKAPAEDGGEAAPPKKKARR